MDQLRTEPWLTEQANQILETIMQHRTGLRVFEYGMGASTIWFAKQPSVEYVYSVEHEQEWFDKTMQLGARDPDIVKNNPHLSIYLRKLPYNDVIKEVEPQRPFDIILVDGRNRVKCIEAAIPFLAKDGILILDNSEREYYSKGIELMSQWQQMDTFQPEPDKYAFTYPGWQTTFFFKDGIPKYLKY